MRVFLQFSIYITLCLLCFLAGCVSGTQKTEDTLHEAPSVQKTPVPSRENASSRMVAVNAKGYALEIPENWRFNAEQSGALATVLDEQGQPRLSISLGRLEAEQNALEAASEHYRQSGGTNPPSRVSSNVYVYSVKLRTGEQVPAIFRSRGRSYTITRLYHIDDQLAAEIAASMRMK